MTTMTFDDLPDPFIIAEVGGNHEGDFQYACKLARDAGQAGANAVKFQAYHPDLIVNKLQSPHRHRHFAKFALSSKQYIELALLVSKLGVKFMASLWDQKYLDLLDPYIDIYKIGSGDLTNRPLIKTMALRNKPICVATAMATMKEIDEFLEFVDEVNPELRKTRRVCIMHCVATYGRPQDRYANLAAIETLRRNLPEDVVVGYSDHTVGTVAIEAAVCMGAKVIEVHFTDDPTREFRDHHFSKDRTALTDFIKFCTRRMVMLGGGIKVPIVEVETPQRILEFRRGVYFSQDVTAGTVASEEDLITLRPCVGIDARDFFLVLGRRLLINKKALEPLSWENFENVVETDHQPTPPSNLGND